MREINPLYSDFYAATLITIPILDASGAEVTITEKRTVKDIDGIESVQLVPVTKTEEVLEYTLKSPPQPVDAEYIAKYVNPTAMDKFAAIAVQTEQWEWFKEHAQWSTEAPISPDVEELLEYPEDEVNPWNIYRELVSLWEDREPVRPEIRTPKQFLEESGLLLTAFKKNREQRLEELTVTIDGYVFNADETSQNRMARSVAAGEAGMSTLWKLADDSVVRVSWTQLRQALLASGRAQTEIWM